MNTITATFRIVTPMFIGGADQTPDDGIRPPSVKGALRFWWRALNWGRFRTETDCDKAALILLHDEEVRLFGGSAEQGGQGVFLLEIEKQPSVAANFIISDWPTNNTGAGYMAYGILESSGGKSGIPHPHREGIKESQDSESQDFTLKFRFRPGVCPEDRSHVLAALNAWSLFGGLGSRSRRGMGSITCLGPDGSLLSRQGYELQVKQLIETMTKVPVPPYTAMSSESYFCILSEGNEARSVLMRVGQKYKTFRGPGSQLSREEKISFGLPLQEVDEANRRASPLLFHVHALANNRYVAVALYLPSSKFHKNYPPIDMAQVKKFVQGASR